MIETPWSNLFDLVNHMSECRYSEDVIDALHGHDLSFQAWNKEPYKTKSKRVGSATPGEYKQGLTPLSADSRKEA